MSEFKDHFSTQAPGYSRYRPDYPEELFSFLSGLCEQRHHAWDCGCGTGQAAYGLARCFDRVTATDGSAAQIGKAVPGETIEYRVATAEQSGLPDASVDLVLVAQALHWFDFDAFYREVRRVLRPGGVLAVVAYGLMRINPDIDRVIERLYVDLLGDYWPPERKHIDQGYAEIPFPYTPMQTPGFDMQAAWHYDHCIGYLETWSAVQRFRTETGACPVEKIAGDLRYAWGECQNVRRVSWPLYLMVARIESTGEL